MDTIAAFHKGSQTLTLPKVVSEVLPKPPAALRAKVLKFSTPVSEPTVVESITTPKVVDMVSETPQGFGIEATEYDEIAYQ